MSDGMKQFIEDMWAIGVLVSTCLGCGKIDCGSCPCGTATSVNHKALAEEASKRLKAIFVAREKRP